MRDILGWIGLSIGLTILIEWIKFKSLKCVFQFMKETPLLFGINLLIVSSTLALGLLVKRRIFVFTLISIFWIGLSVINTIVTSLRGYPLMFSDIFLIKEGLSLSSQYFTPVVIGSIVLLLGVIFWISYDLFQITLSIKPYQYGLGIFYLILSSYLFNRIEKNPAPLIMSDSEDPEDIGFAYAMADSLYPYLNRKPESYNEEIMQQIKASLQSTLQASSNAHKPNVIMIQVESLFDPLLLQNISISQDPMPTIRQLMNHSISGKLSVPTFGGGTGKTEFEVLSGMNADYLGPGEIPHNSFLRQTAVESLATTFKRHGYDTIAIHNYEGNFYNRHLAYQNLGFDRFVPIEYMPGIVVDHDLSKMDDQYLFDTLLKALNNTQPSFIYAITAGTHQPYDDSTYDEFNLIQIEGTLTPEDRNSLQNYCIRLHQFDQQVARLLDTLCSQTQDTVLALFSDHLPNLTLINDEMTYPYAHYDVPYFIYDSKHRFTIPSVQLEAYQLGTYIIQGLELQGGIMDAIHQSYRGQDDYSEVLKLAQYDLIYGKNYLRNGETLTYQHPMQFGIVPISISTVEFVDHDIIIKGQGFNGDSQVYLDYRKLPTTFISEKELRAESRIGKGTLLCLKQISGHHQPLEEGIKINLNQ